MEIDLDKLLKLLEELKSIATNGKTFAESKYDIERYEQLGKKLNELNKDVFKIEEGLELFPVENNGLYHTPQIGVNGLLLNDMGEVLLEKRKDDNCWGLPGGWCEVGKSVEENLVKEIKEETGFDVEIERLIKLVSRMPTLKYPYTSYHAFFQVNIISGGLTCSHESHEVKWWDPQKVEDWHVDHGDWVRDAIRTEE